MRVASAVGNDVWLNTDLAAKFLIRREVIARRYGSRTGSGAMTASMTQPASEQQADERREHDPARWCRRQIEPDRLRRRRADPQHGAADPRILVELPPHLSARRPLAAAPSDAGDDDQQQDHQRGGHIIHHLPSIAIPATATNNSTMAARRKTTRPG